MKRAFVLLYCVVSIMALSLTGAKRCLAQSERYIRVAIVPDGPSINIKVSGSFEIIDLKSQKVIYRARNLKATVAVSNNTIFLGEIASDSDRLFIKTAVPDSITINGRRFRDNVQIIRNKNARLLVANHINLEDYIKGILYNEVSHYWPIEVLKAQAIVCRTYAVYQMQENALRDYDVTADVYSQVYGGRSSERYRTNRAVAETRDQVLVYKGHVMPAYYHAACGGHTEDASRLWNIQLPPLRGVPCSFCRESPHFRWHMVMPLKEIEDKLKASGYARSGIKGIIILGRDESGRVTDMMVKIPQTDFPISVKDFRTIVGPNIIRSANFSVTAEDADVVFEGLGWGHGVGMCQWGAYFMAKEGHRYEEILTYYYPGTEITSLQK